MQPWHIMGGDDVLRHFDSSAGDGLSSAVVDERRSFYGSNALPGTASRSLPAIWKSQVTCLPVVLTGVAALLSVLTGGMAEGALALDDRTPQRRHRHAGPRTDPSASWMRCANPWT